jgi:hypothetical protein
MFPSLATPGNIGTRQDPNKTNLYSKTIGLICLEEHCDFERYFSAELKCKLELLLGGSDDRRHELVEDGGAGGSEVCA